MAKERPFILWCWHRTGSCVLDRLLKSMSGLPQAPGEPFDVLGRFEHVPSHPDCDELLKRICAEKQTIRHAFYPLPLAFNLALARVATGAGYRHIYLSREPVPRLLSMHIALHLDAWLPGATTREKLAGCRSLPPMNVARQKVLHQGAESDWQAIRALLGSVYPVHYEQLFCGPLASRREALRGMARYLNLDPSRWDDRLINRYLLNGGQQSRDIWSIIPNVAKLREAFA